MEKPHLLSHLNCQDIIYQLFCDANGQTVLPTANLPEVTSLLKQAQHSSLLKTVECDKHQVRLPDAVNTWLLQLKDKCKNENIKALRSHLVTLIASEEARNNDDLSLGAFVLSSLVPKHKLWQKKGVVEDTFIKNQFSDVLDIILGQDEEEIFEYEWCNKQLSGCILKPDYTLFFEDEEEERVEIFVIKVKAPQRNRNSNDFMKLDFTLKSMLDKLVKGGMNSPHVVGLLVDGYDCFLYMMKINHEAIYEFVELETFSKSATELPLLKDLLEAIFRVKAFALEAFEEFEALGDVESESLPLCRFAA